ncbi:hypothetical protein PCASD_22680 [Puccinia coronata f. sp. avenae]|uniref:Uncharacterized protein n=1 Tax=Puccinia coronata f. sp. avenae TaxID=200324 RepID=A0A2N5TJY0_9BASI|nr:hypothetical protein PCASD_22680 [Puccinia coronata f. sp. avenae]
MSASSQIIAVSPTNTIFSSSPISDISDEKTILSPSPISDTLSDDLIPGAPILCKSTRRSQIFWPAALLNDSGVEVPRRRLGHTTHFETLYSVRFCDGTSAKVPRSSFYTTTDQEFYSVKIGEIHTTPVPFEIVLPKIQNVLGSLDSILVGNAYPEDVKQRSDRYLNGGRRTRVEIPAGAIYGHYTEGVVHEVANFLKNRYILNCPQPLIGRLDTRFLNLSTDQQTNYITDIITPEAFLLITLDEFANEALEQGTPQDYFWLRHLAVDCLRKVDIIDLVYSYRPR